MIFEKNSLNCSEQDFRNLFQVIWSDLTQDDGFRSSENLPLEMNKIKSILEGNDFVRKISRDRNFEYGR